VHVRDRGAGEILGENQSGHIQEIGFTLYMELLDRAIKSLKDNKTFDFDASLSHGTEINLQTTALIPDDYLHDVHVRLTLYKRISNAKDERELDELQIEMIDRFGLLPDQTKHLFQLTNLKLRAQAMGIRKIDAHRKGGRIEFEDSPKIDTTVIIELIQHQNNQYKMKGEKQFLYTIEQEAPLDRINNLEKLLDKIRLK